MVANPGTLPVAAKIRYVCGGLVLFPVSNLSKKYFVSSMASLVVFCGGGEQSLVVLVDYVDHQLGVLCGGFGIDVVFFAASLCVDFGFSVSFSSSMVPTSSAASLIL